MSASLIPNFYIRINSDGKLVIDFKQCEHQLGAMLWNTVKRRFLYGRTLQPEDALNMKIGIMKMLSRHNDKWFFDQESGEFKMRERSANFNEQKQIFWNTIKEMADDTQ